MQMNVALLLALRITGFMVLTSLGRGADATTPIPVEFSHVGDDSLSQKLAAAVEADFRSSPDFRLSAGNESRRLVIAITKNVEWEKVGKKLRATYTVRFSSAEGYEISSEKGSCWENAFQRCAAQILTRAKTLARKLPQ
jgi:hypothetical protein